MQFYSTFSSKVLHARIDMGYTQKQVADAVSVTTRWYQRIEKGERLPGSIVLLRLILFLNINVEEFREEVGLIDSVSRIQRKDSL